jgi:hypothetical protein
LEGAGRPRLLCGDPRCERDSSRLRAHLQHLLRARRCLLCEAGSVAGSRHCAEHQVPGRVSEDLGEPESLLLPGLAEALEPNRKERERLVSLRELLHR